jgi:predicted nucleic acid-binding protein
VRVVDSSGWIEFFGDGPLAEAFAPHLEPPEEIVTPSLVMYEVYRWARRTCSERDAAEIVAFLEYTHLAPADQVVAVMAADYGLQYGLAAADALIYATARFSQCELITADAHFRGLPRVTLVSEV